MFRASRLALPLPVLVVSATALLAATVSPVASGTVEYFPYFGIYQMPVGDTIQSTCAQTTPTNLAYRRGFMEYLVPSLPGKVARATLVVVDRGGSANVPVPPVIHHLSYYDADLAATLGDYTRPATQLTTFETDGNRVPQTFRFDVTNLVRQYAGRALGFRIQMESDPLGACPDYGGTGFGSLYNSPPVLEIQRAGRRVAD